MLGLLTAQERFEFEQICAGHPEVKAACEAFELQLEKQAMENAIAPPAELKQKISDAVFSAPKNVSVIREQTPVRKMNTTGAGWIRTRAGLSRSGAKNKAADAGGHPPTEVSQTSGVPSDRSRGGVAGPDRTMRERTGPYPSRQARPW